MSLHGAVHRHDQVDDRPVARPLAGRLLPTPEAVHRAGYEDTVKQVKAEIGDVPLQRLTTAHIQKMVEKWHTIGTCEPCPLAALTIKKQITNLATALNKAVDLSDPRTRPPS